MAEPRVRKRDIAMGFFRRVGDGLRSTIAASEAARAAAATAAAASSASARDDAPLREGALLKRRDHLMHYMPRVFVLYHDRLDYYMPDRDAVSWAPPPSDAARAAAAAVARAADAEADAGGASTSSGADATAAAAASTGAAAAAAAATGAGTNTGAADDDGAVSSVTGGLTSAGTGPPPRRIQGSNAKGTLPLDRVTRVVVHKPDEPRVFSIHAVGARPFVLAAMSATEATEWARAIDTQASVVNPERWAGARNDKTPEFARIRANRWHLRDLYAASTETHLRTLAEAGAERHESIPWKPDVLAENCTVCATKMSKHGITGRRRHHCRLCGDVCCSACTKTTRRITAKDNPSAAGTGAAGAGGARQLKAGTPIDLRVCTHCVRALSLLQRRRDFAEAVEEAEGLPVSSLSSDMLFARDSMVQAVEHAEYILGYNASERPPDTLGAADFAESLDEVTSLLRQIRVTFPQRLKALRPRTATELTILKNMAKVMHSLFDELLPRLKLRQRMLQHKVNVLKRHGSRADAGAGSRAAGAGAGSAARQEGRRDVAAAAAAATVHPDGDVKDRPDAAKVGLEGDGSERAVDAAAAASPRSAGYPATAAGAGASAPSASYAPAPVPHPTHEPSAAPVATPAPTPGAPTLPPAMPPARSATLYDTSDSPRTSSASSYTSRQSGVDVDFGFDAAADEAMLAEIARREESLSTVSTAFILLQRLALEHIMQDDATPGYAFAPYSRDFKSAIDTMQAEIEMATASVDNDPASQLQYIDTMLREWDTHSAPLLEGASGADAAHSILRQTVRIVSVDILTPINSATADGELQPSKNALAKLVLRLTGAAAELRAGGGGGRGGIASGRGGTTRGAAPPAPPPTSGHRKSVSAPAPTGNVTPPPRPAHATQQQARPVRTVGRMPTSRTASSGFIDL